MCKNIYIEEISGNFDGFDSISMQTLRLTEQ